MELNQQYYLMIFFLLLHSAIVLLVTKHHKNSASERTKQVSNFILLDGLFFGIGSIVIFLVLPQPDINLVSFMVYNLILSYVIAIEIPGYFSIQKYDREYLQVLQNIRKLLLKMYTKFEVISDIKKEVNNNLNYLENESIGELLNDFIDFNERLSIFNIGFWELSLKEITDATNQVSSRSKHPFPKLIDILSLTGLSFIIAQLIEAIV